MAETPQKPAKFTELRRRAEKLLKTTRQDIAAMPIKDVQQLVHELQVHQIELEMQNEELRLAQAEIEEARDRYADLYDFSPIGHLTLNTQGKVLESNLKAATMLGVDRMKLIGEPLARFIASDDRALIHRHCQEALKPGARPACAVRLGREAGVYGYVRIESFPMHEKGKGLVQWRTTLLDITDWKVAEARARDSKTQFQAMLDHSPSLIWIKDLQGRYLEANRPLEQMLHRTHQEILGKTDQDLFAPEQAAVYRANDLTVVNAGRALQFEEVALHDDGPHSNIVTKFLLRHPDGSPYAVCGIATDITERKQAEESLRLAKFSIERASDAVYWIDPQAKILDVNEVASLMLGYSRDELLAMTVHDLNPGFQADRWPEFWAETKRRGTMVMETSHRAKNGRLIPIEVSVNYLSYEGKDYHCAFVRDITERKKAEEALHQSQRELRRHEAQLEDLTSKLFAAQDNERQRIARDLHDDFSQRLAALVLDVVSLEQRPPLIPEVTAKLIQPVREQLEQLSDDLHNLAYRLHPSLIEHAGLKPAIEDHIGRVAERTKLRIAFKAKVLPSSIPLDCSTCLFRVLQESLQNVVKHAEATEVRIELSGSSKGIGLSVTDNGKGFDVSDRSVHRKGLGVISMEERLRSVQGFLRIHSLPFDGTKVCAWIPFKEGHNDASSDLDGG